MKDSQDPQTCTLCARSMGLHHFALLQIYSERPRMLDSEYMEPFLCDYCLAENRPMVESFIKENNLGHTYVSDGPMVLVAYLETKKELTQVKREWETQWAILLTTLTLLGTASA